MMDAFERLLEQYGEKLTLRREDGSARTVRAFVQPISERREERELPTALGLARRDRYLYLGEAETDLAALGGGYFCRGGERFRVRSAHPVRVAGKLSHWWAVLEPREGE